jgi:hypothetical protein
MSWIWLDHCLLELMVNSHGLVDFYPGSTNWRSGRTYFFVRFRRVRKIAESDYQLRHVGTSVCPTVRPHGTMDRLSWNLMFEYFSKICWETSSFCKILQKWRVFFMNIDIHFWSELIYIYIYFFFFKSCRMWDDVEKHCRAGQATDEDVAHAHCILETKAANAHSEYIILAFALQQCYVIRTLPVLFPVVLLSSVLHWEGCFLCTGGQDCRSIARIP